MSTYEEMKLNEIKNEVAVRLFPECLTVYKYDKKIKFKKNEIGRFMGYRIIVEPVNRR